VIAVDGLVIIAIGAIAADAVRFDDARFADAAILLAIIAFVGTGIVARFIERRGG
jgi:multisubunit Na+/H+ antiporter MnhF subunit